ncbi:MAG: CDP-diacylglycerol--serine O-phosphatidyltransferase [Rhodospirillaceae bacterium]|nr:CDP-diacylglycerol--serine O-phosphatidyltransferase [Rhodospirillaceae bacterium]
MSKKKNNHIATQPLHKLIPNMITIMALCAGLTSIRFTLQGRWEDAVAAIFVAAILDGLDGRIARLLKATSRFGAELDSLSDFVSFGVAPAVLIYQASLFQLQAIGWAIVLIYTICCALRLARFNINSQLGYQPNSYDPRFFTGLPSPAAAVLALLPIIINFEIKKEFVVFPWGWGIWLMVVAILMISRFPTLSLKSFRIKQELISTYLLIGGMITALVATFPWLVIITLALAYLAFLPVGYHMYRRGQRAKENPFIKMPKSENHP